MGAVKDYITSWEHPPGNSQCGDCDHRYCAFCDPTCPRCHGFHIFYQGERFMRVYGQSSEDYILWQLLKDDVRDDGMYLDVGALDGARFSNTLLFELQGWTGICIEAHPDFIESLLRNRPESKCVHCAAGHEDNDDFELHANFLGTLSTIEPSLEGEFRQRYPDAFDGFELMKVPMRRLDRILRELHIDPRELDLVSIDVEGGEVKVLEGFNLAYWQPRVVLIEAFNYGYEERLETIFAEAGYQRARIVANNLFFCRDDQDVAVIAHASPAARLTHTRNPLHRRCK